MENVTLERALPEDAALLTEIIVDSFAEEVKLYGRGPRNYDSVQMRRKCIEDGNYYFRIMAEGTAAGAIGAFLSENGCRIGVIALRREQQNRGLGSMAMRQLELAFPAVRRFHLETPHKSFRNHHFYEKLGYKKYKEVVEDPKTGFTLFLYEKTRT